MLKTVEWDFRRDQAQTYANALRNAIELHIDNDVEKHEGFFLSAKGCSQARGNFEDKLYFGNIHYVENHLRYNDEELQEDDQIINVVYIDGPVTRDGGACSYGTKEYRDQVMYANNIPQVVFHLFIVNTPGGESACRNDYDMMIADCRKNNKPTVMFVDGQCCSSGVNLGCRCDCVVVMNPKDNFGCIGSMAAFWATPDGAVDSRDGSRFIEIVGDQSPDKNGWYRKAAEGDYEELKELINKDTEEFHQTVRENRPLVEDWMLTGKVFEAQELIPALVDEIGDLNRAIECGFDLANQTRTAARFMTAEPKEDPASEPALGKEPEEKKQDLTHQNENIMTKEEKKAAEAAEEQQAAEQVEQPASEEAAAEEAPATEAPAVSEETTEEEKPTEEAPAAEEEQKPAEEEEEPAEEEKPAEEAPATDQPASDEAIKAAEADIDKIQDTLRNAEQLVEQRDQEIVQLKESLATLKGIADERDAAVKERNDMEASFNEQGKALSDAEAKIAEHVATIETLKKQVADMKAEVKELAGKPAPMVDAAAGVPQDNGTGEAPKQNGSGITMDMDYKQIRAAVKKKAAKKQA